MSQAYCDFCAALPANTQNPNKAYHDTEYGVPVQDDNILFERLVLEINQAGLSWTTILNKRPAFQAAYAQFNIATVAAFSEADIARQLQHCGAHWHRAQKAVAVRIRDSAHIQAALNAEADLLYLGGELINNRHILHELGSLNVPVVVCKDIHHTVRDWLIAAEQIALRGNQHILLGEAGTLSLHSAPVRLDVEAIAQAKQQSHLPVLANISTLAHRHMPVATLRRLAIAAGADVIIE